jgi:hypothetical protein
MKYVPVENLSTASERAREFYWRNILRIHDADPMIREGALHDLIRRHGRAPEKKSPERQRYEVNSDAFSSVMGMIPNLSRSKPYFSEFRASDIKRLLTELLPPDDLSTEAIVPFTRNATFLSSPVGKPCSTISCGQTIRFTSSTEASENSRCEQRNSAIDRLNSLIFN